MFILCSHFVHHHNTGQHNRTKSAPSNILPVPECSHESQPPETENPNKISMQNAG